MTHCIYGFRLVGDTECRYVGMTTHEPADRLKYRMGEARRFVRWKIADPDGLHQWLLKNEGTVEAFTIAKAGTRADALETERAIVAVVLCLGHRLFNHWLVPSHKRIGWKTLDERRKARCQAAA